MTLRQKRASYHQLLLYLKNNTGHL